MALGRFVIGVRAFLFPLAGSARTPYTQFLFFGSVGALIWSGVFILAGRSVGGRVEALESEYRAGAMILAGAFAAGLGAILVMTLYRRRRHGPGSLRGRMIARVEKTLPPRSGPLPTGLRRLGPAEGSGEGLGRTPDKAEPTRQMTGAGRLP